jgi:hypothetical protein
LQECGPFEIDLVPWVAGRERLIESGARLLEAMEPARQLRSDVVCVGAGGQHRNRLGTNQFRSFMVLDTAKRVTMSKQKLRQCHQIVKARAFATTELETVDRGRKIGDGNSAARIASGLDHDAFFRPVSSAG